MMNECAFHSQVDAYYDSELSAEQRTAFEAHLQGCEACATRLAELKAMSGMFAEAAGRMPALSQISLHRLHHRLADEMDRGLLRIAWTLSGVAASIMLIGSAMLMRIPGDGSTPQAAPPWVGVSASFETETVAQNASSPTAQWYLADATRSDDYLENR